MIIIIQKVILLSNEKMEEYFSNNRNTLDFLLYLLDL
jgi:hypothetical protein